MHTVGGNSIPSVAFCSSAAVRSKTRCHSVTQCEHRARNAASVTPAATRSTTDHSFPRRAVPPCSVGHAPGPSSTGKGGRREWRNTQTRPAL